MELQFADDDIYSLAGIDIEQMCSEIKERVFLEELYSMKTEEINVIKKLVAKCLDLDVEAVSEENTRSCFHTYDGKLIVLKLRKFNVRLLFQEIRHLSKLVVSGRDALGWVLASVITELFFDTLDGDCNLIFTFLCKETFAEGKKISNIEIYDILNDFIKTEFGDKWSHQKIDNILRKLEEAKVLEWDNGKLQLLDRIVF